MDKGNAGFKVRTDKPVSKEDREKAKADLT